MDKRSDGVRCRRSLSAVNRLDTSSAQGLMVPAALKEDKIRFLLEAAEAARGGGGSVAQRPAVPPPPAVVSGPFGAMSLGQYVNALTSCLPGTAAGIRPLLWTQPPFQALPPPPPPPDGMTSHAALLSTLAGAPLQSIQDPASTTPAAPGLTDRSILNSLLASYATGSPLFSINGLAGSGGGPLPPSSSVDVVPPGTNSPLRCASSERPAIPQDLSMSAAKNDGADCGRTGSKTTSDTSFFSATSAALFSASTTSVGSAGRHPAMDLTGGSPTARQLANLPADFGASGRRSPWPAATFGGTATSDVKRDREELEEEATDLSVRGGAEAVDRSYRKSPTVSDSAAGTMDLSSRAGGGDRYTHARSPFRATGYRRDFPANGPTATDDSTMKSAVACCDENAASCCPHLAKLKELRRNVYRMLSVFTPYLDVSGAGIADTEADAVDDFLHEVIYSSKLDQATD